jgi:hypothetical protein
VGIRAKEDAVSDFLACTVAAHFMANRIVAPVVDPPPGSEARQAVHEALGALLACDQPNLSTHNADFTFMQLLIATLWLAPETYVMFFLDRMMIGCVACVLDCAQSYAAAIAL